VTRRPEILRVRGPEAIRERARRQAAQNIARRFLCALVVALEGKSPEFVIEVARWVIRAMSKVVEANGDASRATGVLAGAQADLIPAWVSERAATHADAEALFAGAGE
jgi:hypothetical protein